MGSLIDRQPTLPVHSGRRGRGAEGYLTEKRIMGFLENLWDDTLAGPAPARLRKLTPPPWAISLHLVKQRGHGHKKSAILCGFYLLVRAPVVRPCINIIASSHCKKNTRIVVMNHQPTQSQGQGKFLIVLPQNMQSLYLFFLHPIPVTVKVVKLGGQRILSRIGLRLCHGSESYGRSTEFTIMQNGDKKDETAEAWLCALRPEEERRPLPPSDRVSDAGEPEPLHPTPRVEKKIQSQRVSSTLVRQKFLQYSLGVTDQQPVSTIETKRGKWVPIPLCEHLEQSSGDSQSMQNCFTEQTILFFVDYFIKPSGGHHCMKKKMVVYKLGRYILPFLFAWAGGLARLLEERVLKTRRRQNYIEELEKKSFLRGPNPISNTALVAVLEKAKELDVPKDILERNIKRASEKGQEAYIEKIYEVYGFGGVSIVVEVSTDKINRCARVVNIKVFDTDKDQLLDSALDAGAEDVIEPPVYEDDSEEDGSNRYYKIVTSLENYSTVLSKLREEGINFEPDNGSELLPIVTVEVDDESMDLNKALLASLLDLEDVDAVYTDQK
ncbi:hypothetical protein SAY87_005693 [Trapa incisa]|uniref:TACO1/YebC-like second and third domain-containing protein n=1 Tax=Trapa incisa TaxID=236973 RepID=A0AAN7K569_9MYRT|nr:hypothetical protein SAY87_005693 [Trapa incisa]